MDVHAARRNRRSSGDSSVAAEEAPYAFEQWEEELFEAYALGVDPHPCPHCGHTGFFGPRFAEPDLRYRGCRFCGFWQEVADVPRQATPVVHGCDAWPHVARAPYLWWVPPSRTSFTCPFCDAVGDVVSYALTPPHDDPNHPWWKVHQRRPARFYRRFWENWSVTKGRLYL